MTEDEIDQMMEDHRRYQLPDVIMERAFSLALVSSGDPMFLLKVPEPWRTRIIQFGREVKDQWVEVSSDGMVDYSQHAKPLNSLVTRFLREVSVGKYMDWHGPKKDLT